MVANTAKRCGHEEIDFTCVAASELESDLRRCYVENFPDIEAAYVGHHRLASAQAATTISDQLLRAALPKFSAEGDLETIHGDMNCFLDENESGLRKGPGGQPLLPSHDLLCAGFPCQPFSKSGAQRGFEDTRGTVFHSIATILREHRPAFLLLENVGNFARHDGGNTWSRVRKILEEDLGYDIVATEHVGDKANGLSGGLLSPHHLGYPHHRERFFILGQRRRPLRSDSDVVRGLLRRPIVQSDVLPSVRGIGTLSTNLSATMDTIAKKALVAIISQTKNLREAEDLRASQITPDRVRCINHWAKLLAKLAEMDNAGATPSWKDSMPSFPIWAYELDPWNWYPIDKNPADRSTYLLRLAKHRQKLLDEARREVKSLSGGRIDLERFGPEGQRKWLTREFTSSLAADWVATWPSYAGARSEWPRWKQRFIEQNRSFALRLWSSVDPSWLRSWLETLYVEIAVSSYMKLEWNCKGEDLNIWDHILQFRPSGLRVKRLAHVPALVAMTTTQIPIIPRLNNFEPTTGAVDGARGRHLVPSEALQLQGFPANWSVPEGRERSFTCFGNAVHAGVVHDIIAGWLLPR